MRLTSILILLLGFYVATGQKKTYVQPKKSVGYAHKKSPVSSNKNPSPTSFSNAPSHGPNITGIWKGYFVQNNLGFIEDRYRFEVQLAQENNNSLKSVTYSYKTTEFYGKAEAIGIFTQKTSNVLLQETKLVDLKITNANSGACLMTCYMDYEKVGKMETLTGTYTSVSLADKSDCGIGKVYLEKKETSDFEKEDFVAKRETELSKKKGNAKKSATPKLANVAENKPVKKSVVKPIVRPGAENDLITKSIKKLLIADTATVLVPKKSDLTKAPLIKISPKPDVIKNRINDLVRTITTSEKEFKVDLYDNGDIDGDRISVYHNNELIISDKLLTDKPISFTITCNDNIPVHEFVMVAENLGTIPPNTALMIITAGSQRYELTLSSTEQKNAVVRVQYKADD